MVLCLEVYGWRELGPVLDRVADQVLKQLRELRLVSHDARQCVMADLGPTFLDRYLEIAQRLTGDLCEMRNLLGAGLPTALSLHV